MHSHKHTRTHIHMAYCRIFFCEQHKNNRVVEFIEAGESNTRLNSIYSERLVDEIFNRQFGMR